MSTNERKPALFAHLAKYGVSLPETIRLMVFPEDTENVITKLTSKMCQARELNRHRLAFNRCYFTLGPEAARENGISMKRVKPRGSIALTRALATLLYCARNPGRELLTAEELQSKLPGVASPRVDSQHYYLDRDGDGGPVRLGMIRADCHAEVAHLVRRCGKDITRRREIPAIARLIEQDRFVIALVTSTEEKAAALKSAINKERLPARFRLFVAPELLLILGGQHERPRP